MAATQQSRDAFEILKGVEEDFHRLLDCFFEARALSRVPLRHGVRAHETKSKIIVDIAVPETTDPQDIEITIEGRQFSVECPCSAGRPRQRHVIELRCDVDETNIEAHSHGKMISVHLPKKTRRIEIKEM